ncbi:MAG: hypothetical protein HN344_09735, partial [Gammaproteobacteria bacterium]|nr:hypothetical protein [Gammaproteobacteria bacterium]
SHSINLSIKQKESLDEEKAIKDYNEQNAVEESTPTTIGDLIKKQMDA